MTQGTYAHWNPNSLHHRDFTATTVFGNLCLIAVLVFINRLGAPGNAVFFVVLLAMAAKSSEHAVRALSLMYLVLVSNTALVSTGSIIFSAGKFVFLFLVAGRLLYSLSLQGQMVHRIPAMGPLALFCFVALLLAIEGGYFAHISALKLVSFMTGFVCILAAERAMRYRRHQLDAWFFSIIIYVMLIGIFTYVAGLGYSQRLEFGTLDHFFNGPFYHSQTLGPATALILIWLVGFGVLTKYRLRLWSLPLIPVFLVFLYLSSSRTSLLAIGVAIIVALLALAFMHSSALWQIMRIFRRAFLTAVVLGMAIATLEFARPGSVVGPVLDFVVKRGSVEYLRTEDVLFSRQSLIDMMMENIRQDPWTGIGFGTSTHPAFVNTASLLRAPTEKGVLPIAIVEETGFIGAAFFVIFIMAMFAYLIRSSSIVGLLGFAALLGINMAEMNFFSFGGHGGFFWIWVMACMLMMPATRGQIVTPPRQPSVASGQYSV